MRKGMSNFFKSSAFVKSFFVFGAAFFATLSISCKQLASFDPVVNGEQTVVSGGTTSETAEFAFNLKATHGLVRKISLEWTAFSGAKYYEIYFAESSSAEFAKIGETEQPFFDDAVGAGRTGYFKVCAVKANGASSPFSSTVVGTSLAVPIISDGEVGESEANISWSMENARGIDGTDYYEKTLKFEVVCQPKGGSDGETKVLSASSFSGSSYSCKFENLSSSQDYEFYIEAYLEGDTQSREKSPTVDKTTLTAYTPLAPKFTASEGDNAKGISLLITLPEMVSVNTVTEISPDEKVDKLYPLCFEIYRKHAETYPADPVGGTVNGDKCRWYYDGTKLTKTPVEYKEDGKPYEAGRQVIWFDDDASLIGGVKYDYMIRSFVDINYSKVVCPKGKEYEAETGTPKNKATTAQGWKSAHPSFKVKSGKDVVKTFREDEAGNNVEVLSYEFGFSAEWNDLGKADDYKFAIKQNRKPLDANDSDGGTDTWLGNDGSVFFATLDEINSRQVKFGSESGLTSDEEGLYTYTLYIVPKDVENIEEIKPSEDESKELCHAEAIDKILVTKSVDLPKPEFAVKDGFTTKVELTVSNLEPNVKYEVTRTTILKDGIPPSDSEEKTTVIPLYETGDVVTDTTFKKSDIDVQANCRYSYVLKATDKHHSYSLSESQVAETLGTPKVSFKKDEESFGYDSVTISFDGVLAAKDYSVTLGTKGGFGGGNKCTFAAGSDSTSENMTVSLAGNTYTVTINNPEGYNDAKKAGVSVDAVVMADSGKDTASGSVPVNVLGPALLEAKVDSTKATDESISLTWKEVKDAKGYLIRRVMYSDAAMTKVANGSGVTYYYEVASKKVTVDGEDVGGRCTVAGDASLTLTDTYMEKSGDNVDLEVYHEAQAKIAWGLPFRYVVLPVLGKDDFSFDELKLADGGKVAYTNLAPTAATATWGYGLNLVADKATSGNKQGAKWEKPHVDKAGETDYTATKPVVYRRVAGEPIEPDELVKFERFRDSSDEISSEKAVMDIKPGDNAYYGAFEYIVKYYPTTGKSTDETISPPYSLLAEIAKRTTQYETPDGSMTEQDNKGYLLTIENFSAENYIDSNKKATYYEKLSWKEWSYNTRAVGPDSMMIFIQNNNIGADPQEAVKIEQANSDKKIEYVGKDIDGASLGPASLRIAPASIVAGTKSTTDGYLKVLRDYKHNYTFELKRNDGEKEITVPNKDYDASYIKTAYRQITIDEFAKAAIIGMSTGIEKERGTKGSKNDGDGITGLKSTSSYNASTDFTLTFKYDNYVARHTTKSGEEAYAVKINGTLKARGGTTDAYQSQYFSKDAITITYENLGTGTIYFNGKDEWLSWNKGTYPVNRTKGTIDITYNGLSKTYDMSKASDNGWTLPFTLTGGNLNNSEDWQ